MLIVGLVGGTEEQRLSVAQQVKASRRVRFSSHELLSPSTGAGRVDVLRTVVLGDLINSGPGDYSFNRGLVLTHVLTRQEADFIRSKKGMLWHLSGVPSDVIPIQREDLLVTDQAGGDRHYLDPFEAVSEALLRYHTKPSRGRIL